MHDIVQQFRLLVIGFLLALALPAFAGDAENQDRATQVSDYIGQTLDGKKVLLSEHAGKVIVVSFWATWCPYCLKELPILNGMQKLAGKEQMHVVAVNTEERAVFRKVVRALDKLDLSFAYDPDKRAQEAYKVKGIPHMMIVGRDGKILHVHRGYADSMLDQIVEEINAALAAPAAQAADAGAAAIQAAVPAAAPDPASAPTPVSG